MADLIPFSAISQSDLVHVGGKGLSLGLMRAHGLNVPPGFVITTSAYRRLHQNSLRTDPQLVQQIRQAYEALGSGLVAVRSSATAEDGVETSFAGQQDTFLGILGEDALLNAIEACWRSLHTDRAKAYREQTGIKDEQLAMAVVVQKLVPAEVAGVLFTRDPLDPDGKRISIEASWGLGESVVSGKVTPDRFTLDFATGNILSQQLGSKPIQFNAEGEFPVAESLRSILCLDEQSLRKLAELARQVEAFYQSPRDVEWAIVGKELFLLQARPITSQTAKDRELLRQGMITEVRKLASPLGTVWVRYNLSEVLPEPTPMTWSIIQRLLAADGGFGAMNRSLGGSPDPSLGSLSAFDLIAGRPMCNLSRLPLMQFTNPPIEYPFAALKAEPAKALTPRPVMNTMRGGLLGLLRLPLVMWKLSRMQSTIRNLADQYSDRLTKEILPQFKLTTRTTLLLDLSTKTPAELVTLLDEWCDKTLVEFAQESLKPTVLADFCWSTLLELLKPRFGEENAQLAMGEVTIGAAPPADCDYALGIQKLCRGELSRAAFLEQFGHRCQNEMELSQPRWKEDSAAVDRLLVNSPERKSIEPHDPWPGIAERGKLGPATRAAGAKWAAKLRTYLGLREAAKHHLLLGYAVIRKLLVELDGRFKLSGGIFYLNREELVTLLQGHDLTALIRARQKQRKQELSLELPAVLFSDDLEAIGRQIPLPVGVKSWTGIALSAGVVEAMAFVVTDPSAPPPEEPFVLVCPSTDPAWVPLFAKAKALIMETGGVLSHGAIVAREFGLPAVAGLPGIVQQLQSGQRVRVDGAHGTVVLVHHEGE
jgi:rifampicin phosphotransferase